jgi:hypothetical protein
MSLDKVAQHLAAQGRGSDSVLVHMSPKEVGALQHMAKQHGGSLSINPQTGLPEAGFLDAILPMVAGAGLAMIPGVGPLMAAGIVGGGTALLTKDLNKGLMAGLGAFGGAGLAGGIMNAGAAAMVPEVTAAGNAASTAFGAGTAADAVNFLTPENFANLSPETLQSLQGSVSGAANPADVISAAAKANTAATAPTGWDAMTKGFQATKFDSNFLKNNMLPIGAALAPALMGGNLFGGNNAAQQQTANAGYIRPYTYNQTRNPGYTGAGTPYYTQTMTPGTPIASGDYGSQPMPLAAEGGIMDTRRMAEGGIADVPVDPAMAQPATPVAKTPSLADYVAAAHSANVAAQNIKMPVMQSQFISPQQQYTAPVNQVPQAVTDYNNMLGQRAQQEYVQQPQLSAMVPQQLRPAPIVYKAPDLTPTTPIAPQKTELQKLQEQMDAMRSQQQQQNQFAGYGADNSGGGEANGGLMQSYAAGGGIGANYTGFDDHNNAIDTSAQFNQGPQYPMQKPQNFAYGGGITNSRQAAVQSYAAAAQKSPTAMKELLAKAQGGDYDAMIALNSLQGTPNQNYAAGGGIYNLGGYSDGGRLLKGPGDGVSDDIPAQIGTKQPARLADGEFVVPARIVSELGNGSTDAGAKRLYAMMERVQNGRKKSVGKDKVAVDSKSYKHLPA